MMMYMGWTGAPKMTLYASHLTLTTSMYGVHPSSVIENLKTYYQHCHHHTSLPSPTNNITITIPIITSHHHHPHHLSIITIINAVMVVVVTVGWV